MAIRSISPTKPATSLPRSGYDSQYGARPLKRAIQKYLEDRLAELIIESELLTGDEINVSYLPGAEELNTEIIHAADKALPAAEQCKTLPSAEDADETDKSLPTPGDNAAATQTEE